MPKTKYAGKRKRTYKRKSTSVVKKLVKKVNKLYRGIETKHSRTSGLGALPDNDPTLAIYPYAAISQGSGDYSSRVGDKITSRFLKFKSVWTLTELNRCRCTYCSFRLQE